MSAWDCFQASHDHPPFHPSALHSGSFSKTQRWWWCVIALKFLTSSQSTGGKHWQVLTTEKTTINDWILCHSSQPLHRHTFTQLLGSSHVKLLAGPDQRQTLSCLCSRSHTHFSPEKSLPCFDTLTLNANGTFPGEHLPPKHSWIFQLPFSPWHKWF